MDGVVQINQTLHVSMLISVCASRVLVHMCVYVYVCVSVCVNPAQHTCPFVSRELGEEPLSSL